MGVSVEENRILRTRKTRHHAQVGLVARGENNAVLALQEFRKFGLKLLVQGIAAIGNARARGARAEFRHRILARLDAIRVKRNAHIIVRARQNGFAAVDHGPRRRENFVIGEANRIHAHGHHAGVAFGNGFMLVQQINHDSNLLCSGINHRCEFANAAGFRHYVERYFNVKMIFNFHHKIHHRDRIDVEIG